jgi:TRAP-type uncharacterized transport system substrate-binding protein
MPQYLPAQQVADKLREGAIDAFFSVSGWPQSAVADLAATSASTSCRSKVPKPRS